MGSKCASWKASGCTLVALVHVPNAELSGVPLCSAAPGHHGPKSNTLWLSFNALLSIKTFMPEMCVATCQQGSSATADTEFFDSIFGMGMDVESLRLPTAGWKLRCQPVALNPRLTTRPCNAESCGPFKLEDFHVKLHGVFLESRAPCEAAIARCIGELSRR